MKKLIALAVIAAPGFAAAAPSANTINFLGEVTAQTCQVTINGNATTPVVLLPTVQASTLAAAGSVVGETPFTLGVTGCVAPTSAAQAIKAVFVGNNVTSSGNLGNTAAGGATNVELQILNGVAGTPVNLSSPATVAGISLPVGATSASHDYAVQYKSVPGGATAGAVTSSMQYTVSYQ
ncbi:type 1 fimbrial protein [Pseudomonas cavernicola]|uniref:Type 1 fimbrial protein n=2 Tax=Pseudomonas cavernicola TaxID=2320866 RepID=A0A418XPI4_9PSED|nr:type 1 fimbrial protein [Pseudomonas cavernicola]